MLTLLPWNQTLKNRDSNIVYFSCSGAGWDADLFKHFFLYSQVQPEAPGRPDVQGSTGRSVSGWPAALPLIGWLNHHRWRRMHPSSSPQSPPPPSSPPVSLQGLLQPSVSGPGHTQGPALLVSGPHPPTLLQVEAPAGCSGALAAGAGCPPVEGRSADPDEDAGFGAGGDAAAAGGAAGIGAGAAADGGAGSGGDADSDCGGTGPNLAWPHYAQILWTGSWGTSQTSWRLFCWSQTSPVEVGNANVIKKKNPNSPEVHRTMNRGEAFDTCEWTELMWYLTPLSELNSLLQIRHLYFPASNSPWDHRK